MVVRQHLTQAELAHRAGVSREWLIRLEQGHPRLEVQLVLDVLAAAGLALTTSSAEPLPTDPSETTWDELFPHLTGESDDG